MLSPGWGQCMFFRGLLLYLFCLFLFLKTLFFVGVPGATCAPGTGLKVHSGYVRGHGGSHPARVPWTIRGRRRCQARSISPSAGAAPKVEVRFFSLRCVAPDGGPWVMALSFLPKTGQAQFSGEFTTDLYIIAYLQILSSILRYGFKYG